MAEGRLDNIGQVDRQIHDVLRRQRKNQEFINKANLREMQGIANLLSVAFAASLSPKNLGVGRHFR